ncbi:hypothetical protein HK100_002005 [Physocladia obscura]|uniref:Uncharacterized protein n=1 Tax=Physocladia obscura TaxID=109957 RepID=A0AAD5SWE4_9FUNG|nr:hypothetical protein HK100_002005 [Physocladia obscura]
MKAVNLILVTLSASFADAAPTFKKISLLEYNAQAVSSSASTTTDSSLSPLPSGISVPSGNSFIASFQGIGTQNYICSNSSYSLQSVTAVLLDEGSSFDGNIQVLYTFNSEGQPVWTAVDGSDFVGNPIKKMPADNSARDIPNVLLQRASGTSSSNPGALASANFLVRLNTHDGVAPTSCNVDGLVINVDYTAEYYFYGGANAVISPIPSGITVPSGNSLIEAYQGIGTQNYVCSNSTYTLESVTADLFAEGSAFDGIIQVVYTFNSQGQPVWTALDGSVFIGDPITKVPADDPVNDIPNVLLERASGTESPTDGVVSTANYLVRLNTHDGVAPSSCSDEGDVLNVDYSAEYYFYASVIGNLE